MKICYIGKHDQPKSNDDEGSITYSLEKLGHEVQRIREIRAQNAHKIDCDFYLFHHWHDINTLSKLPGKKVYWCFDLIDFPDSTISARCKGRIDWIRTITRKCDLGFLTDGDWVNHDMSGKLYCLRQGADGRIVSDKVGTHTGEIPILFTGITRGGRERQSFVEEMHSRYGKDFYHYQSGRYRESLRELVQSAKIVVAPDGPCTSRYWSNRVYLTLGFGGFLLHPYCDKLTDEYKDCKEIVYYSSREQLHRNIGYYLAHPEQRQSIAEAGLARTKKEHLYEHRVAKLIEIVKERLF